MLCTQQWLLLCMLCRQPWLLLCVLGRQLWLLQAAVVGLSCRHDVMELLEKRVRSRFSHRKQLIPEMEEKHFDQPGNSPKDVLAAMLTMPDSDSTSAQTSGPVQQWNAAVSQILSTDAVIQQLRLMMNQGRRSCLHFFWICLGNYFRSTWIGRIDTRGILQS